MPIKDPLCLRLMRGLGREIGLGGKGKDGGDRSLARRQKQDPRFPRVIYINGRKHLESEAWEKYKRDLMCEGLQKAPSPPPGRKNTAQPTPSPVEDKFESIEPALDTS
jgi:hypothetical protein